MRSILFIILSFFTVLPAAADDVRFSMQVSSRRITIQDYLQVSYMIENSRRVSQFIAPVFRNFTVVEGPEQTSGWNLEGSDLTEYISFSFLLKPDREGKFSIPSATVKIDGKVYRTTAVIVEVVPSVVPGFSEDPSFATELVLRNGETVADKVRNNIFLKLELDRHTCFQGEPVVATYKLYTRLRSESRVTKRPGFSGFSVYDMVNPESEGPFRETYNGKDYNVYLLRKVQLYPLQSGKLEIDPVEVENALTFIKGEYATESHSLGRVLRSLAEGKEDAAVVRESVTISSGGVAVDVKPLPAGDDAFNGAVGQFTVSASVPQGTVRKNDLVQLVVKVSGKGNFPMIAIPEVKWPDGTEVFEPSVQEQFSKFVSPISGSKVFTIPFTPRDEGKLQIPSISMHYFDPASGKYAIAASQPFTIDVAPVPAIIPARTGASDKGRDISKWLWVLVLAALAIVSGSVYLLLRRASKGQVKITPASPTAVAPVEERRPDPLEKIRAAFERGDSREFYRNLVQVIDECMRNKYRVGLNDKWEEALLEQGVEQKMVDTINALREDAVLAMYTPFVMESKMVEDLARIEEIVC